MARTSAGAALTEAHRVAQADLNAQLIAEIVKLFRATYDPTQIAASTWSLAELLLPILLLFRKRSYAESAAYLTAFHKAEVPNASELPPFDPSLLEPDDVMPEQLFENFLHALRAASFSASGKGKSDIDIENAALTAATGRGTRLVQDGGRAAVKSYIRGGWGAVGYARVVDADPCPFCAMLASRGVSYVSGKRETTSGLYRSDAFNESSANFLGGNKFAVHDHCQCTLEPVYARGDGSYTLPGNGEQLAREWAEIAGGKKRSEQQKAWRRWRTSGTLPDDYDGPLEGKRRRERPVSGQAAHVKKYPEVRRKVKKWDEWTKQDFMDHHKKLENKAANYTQSIAEHLAEGASPEDYAVQVLQRELERAQREASRYADHIAKMK